MSILLTSVSLSLLATQGAGVATEAPPSARPVRPIDINLPLTLDDRYLGDIRVFIDGGNVSVDANRLVALLSDHLTPSALAAVQGQATAGRITPEAATTGDIRVSYNSATQQIEVAALVSARGRRLINLGSQQSEGVQLDTQPENLSLFVNTTAAFEYRWQGLPGQDKGRRPLTGTFDVGGRFGGNKGVAFISRQSWSEGEGPALIRDETQLIYDDVDKLLRVTAGDLRYRSASFQSAPQIAGLTVERFFGLQPQRLFRPIGRTQFDLERPSTVEVRLNGVVMQQLLLQPGRYDLRDFPLAQGSNNVELLIRDDTGRETLIGSQSFFDFDLLESGVADFSLSAGVRTRFSPNGIIRYSNDPAFSGFIRYGLSDTLTAGLNVQADNRGATAGGTMLWASPLGVLRFEGSGSSRSGFGSGVAGSVGYFNTGYFNDRKWRWQVNGNIEHFSRDFTTLNDTLPQPGGGPRQLIATSFDLSTTLATSKINFTLTGNYNKARAGRPDTLSGVLGATYNVNDRMSVTLLGRYAKTGLQRDKGAFLQVLWRFGRSSTLRGSYDTSRKEAELQFQRSSPRNVGGLTYDVGLRRNGDADTLNATANAFYTANRGEVSLQHNYFDTANLNGPRVQATRAIVGTSIVFAGGKLAIGRPVQDAFAIVERHRSLGGRKVVIDPTENGARAQTDAFGPAVVPDLQSYDNSSLYLDVDNLPPGYSLGTGEFTLRAPLYSGYRLQAGSSASFTILGDAIYADSGSPVVLIGGELQSIDRPAESPIQGFTNRTGRFAASGLKPGKYRLTLFTKPVFVTEIEVTDSEQTLINLGQIRVTGQ